MLQSRAFTKQVRDLELGHVENLLPLRYFAQFNSNVSVIGDIIAKNTTLWTCNEESTRHWSLFGAAIAPLSA